MIIDLMSFRDGTVSSITVKGELQKDKLEINGRSIKFIEPIRYDGEVYRVNEEKIVHIDVSYVYKEKCGRCLDPFVKRGTTTLSGKLVEETDETTEDEEEEFIYYANEKVDLTDDIMSMIILSLPMKPLCSEDCKGLCPNCGINQNKEDCDCVVENIDPRFSILKDFSPEE